MVRHDGFAKHPSEGPRALSQDRSRDAATVLFNLPGYRVLDAQDALGAQLGVSRAFHSGPNSTPKLETKPAAGDI